MRRLVLAPIFVALMAGSLLAGDWWESVKVKGDLRYRHEMIDKEDSDARHRQRVRARLAVQGQVSDMTKVVIQIATGSDDPVSTNQTLDNSFSTKNIGLDLAYLEMKHDKLPGLKVIGGKFKNPFFKPGSSELIWDSDWNPEGGTATFQTAADDVTFTLTGAGLWIDERSSGDDSWLGAGQAVLRYHLNDRKSSVAFGGSYFNYVNSKGFDTFFESGEPMGNSLDTMGRYLNDYELLELYGEINHHLDEIPVMVMADFVTNTAADSLDTGWLLGVRVGKAKKPGSWAFRYIYREVEQDAVVGTFSDSDFRGGGTDAKGHEIGGSVQLAKNTTFNLSYFVNKIGLDKEESDFNRLQIDLQLKF